MKPPYRPLRMPFLAAALSWVVSCSGYSQTVRVIDGEELAGRPIPSVAYAETLRAAYHEAQGDYPAAIRAYRRALDQDDESVELQTRLAKLSCLSGARAADDEFSAAVNMDARYEPAWREWARCALLRGQARQALRFATNAQRVAPLQFSATEVLVDAFIANGQFLSARRQLVAHLSSAPDNLRGWQRMLDFAERQALPAWERAALESIDRLQPELRVPLSGKPLDTAAQESGEAVRSIALALTKGDLARARELSTEFRLRPTSLALLAAEQGHFSAALAQAKLVLTSSPSNSDARIVGLLSAHRLAERGQFDQLLKLGQSSPEVPSARASRLLRTLIADEVGANAARAWGKLTDPAFSR